VPEPDLAVVPGRRADYVGAHPTHAVLVVEVADSSLRLDRDEKGSLYARARIGEYWIVNLVDRVLETYRDPAPEPGASHGWRYRSVATLPPPALIAPAEFPKSLIQIAHLLL
jgi:Uma2 family endonuclease